MDHNFDNHPYGVIKGYVGFYRARTGCKSYWDYMGLQRGLSKVI